MEATAQRGLGDKEKKGERGKEQRKVKLSSGTACRAPTETSLILSDKATCGYFLLTEN
jgi:hypothetical protein